MASMPTVTIYWAVNACPLYGSCVWLIYPLVFSPPLVRYISKDMNCKPYNHCNQYKTANQCKGDLECTYAN